MKISPAALLVAPVLLLISCGQDATTIDASPDLAAFSRGDIADIRSRDDTFYPTPDEEVRAVRETASGWAACRAVADIYVDLLKTGELAPKPTSVLSTTSVPDAVRRTDEDWIDQLYTPLESGDLTEARDLLADSGSCGLVPAEESGDRSRTVADVVNELG